MHVRTAALDLARFTVCDLVKTLFETNSVYKSKKVRQARKATHYEYKITAMVIKQDTPTYTPTHPHTITRPPHTVARAQTLSHTHFERVTL